LPNKTVAPHLKDRHYLALAIRLLVDAQGNVRQGVVVDLHGRPIGHFRHLAELSPVVRRWLAGWAQEQDHGEPDHLP
jgi:hypothetical protein